MIQPKELVIISGKGGTGKTSLTASFASLMHRAVLADCDVDAADLHLVLTPTIIEKYDFISGHEPFLKKDKCSQCGTCIEMCRFEAIGFKDETIEIDLSSCEGCGVCVYFCPEDVIGFKDRWCGNWMISSTRYGPMIHAKLGIAAENSGKLVSLVREKAREVAQKENISHIIIDGPPGIGCPVIASITGASYVIVVTEPTVSGIHDLERVTSLVDHFNIPCGIVINKWDIHPSITNQIEDLVKNRDKNILGKISYDPIVTTAQLQQRPVVEMKTPVAEEIKEIFHKVMNHVKNSKEEVSI